MIYDGVKPSVNTPACDKQPEERAAQNVSKCQRQCHAKGTQRGKEAWTIKVS